MPNRLHCELLGVSPDAAPGDVKSAYRRLVRRHHPDRFPPEQRPVQERRMVAINLAYRALLRELENSTIAPPTLPTAAACGSGPAEVSEASRELGRHRDPAWVYYKQGFHHYSAAAGGMLARGRYLKLSLDERGLNRAGEALQGFHRAYGFFRRVADEHPESIWAPDSQYRMYRIERFTAIYRRIQRNLRERLQAEQQQAEAQAL